MESVGHIWHLNYGITLLDPAADNEVGAGGKKAMFMTRLTQCVECGDVFPQGIRLLRTRLPQQGVNIMPQTESRHFGWIYVYAKKVLVATKVNLIQKKQEF